jgi:hypothetical protein
MAQLASQSSTQSTSQFSTQPSIVAVAGTVGGGKTQWIAQQIAAATQPTILYCCPGTGNVAIDACWVAAQFPQVTVVESGQEIQQLVDLEPGAIAYVELGFHLDLATEFLTALPCHKVAVLPAGCIEPELQRWADEIITSRTDVSQPDRLPQQMIRSPLDGEVIDPASLDVFWYELTHAGYGKVQRAKGIFDLVDGRSFYFDFVAQRIESQYTELPVPQWLEGRPQRFSGIEIVGDQLDREAIAQTLQDCCLSDEMIAYYQPQIKQQIQQQIQQQQLSPQEVPA